MTKLNQTLYKSMVARVSESATTEFEQGKNAIELM